MRSDLKCEFKDAACIFCGTDLFAALIGIFNASIFPSAQPVERGEREVGSRAALAADQLRAAPDVVRNHAGSRR